MIERDDKMPPLSELLQELDQARRLSQTVCSKQPTLARASRQTPSTPPRLASSRPGQPLALQP